MNEPTDRLRDAAAALPREIAPGRDLWPDIAPHLGAQQPAAPHPIAAPRGAPAHQSRPVRRWLVASACAAAVVTAVVLAGRNHEAAVQDTWRYLALTSLEQDYAAVRGDVLQLLVSRDHDLPAEASADLRAGLDDLDRTVADLQGALRGTPAGLPPAPWLTGQLQRALLQTRGLASLTQNLIRP